MCREGFHPARNFDARESAFHGIDAGPQPVAQHFEREPEGWRVRPALRAVVRCQDWNLLADPGALGHFDIVLCRNVLIYFDPPTKEKALEAIARQMAPDGLLYLGGAETVLGVTERFAPVPGDRGVYALAGAPAAMPAIPAATSFAARPLAGVAIR